MESRLSLSALATCAALCTLCVGWMSCTKDAKPPAAESPATVETPPSAAGAAPTKHGARLARGDRAGTVHAPKGTAGTPAMAGVVLETLAAPPYVYVRLKTDRGEKWVAAPQVEVAVGDELQVREPMEMKGFKSKSLGREFESVYFASALTRAGAGPKPDGHEGMLAPGGRTGMPRPKAPSGVVPQAVAKAEGELGRTVAEVHSQAGALAGKQVTVRGTVVKFNGGIMGRNWLHVQDTTGDSAAGTHDLTVTTDDDAQPGEAVTVTGTVVTDKDFGAGYKYAVMVERARVTADPR
jgi:hypothetical protein